MEYPTPESALPSGTDLASAAEVPFTRWSDVVEALSTACPPLFGVLQGSAAVLRGDYVLIETENELFKTLVSRDGNKKILVDLIHGVTGRVNRIGVRKKPAPAAKSADNDPLSAFIRNSRDLGVPMDIK
ncbi:hypothetical protein SDC9_166128 [bioreactor metagenome]|uniref:Uncharacterized protein n=1 Tax=bioreactor metagenome TaxID=1076179 RepID=A0A645FWE2_9ZZZZ